MVAALIILTEQNRISICGLYDMTHLVHQANKQFSPHICKQFFWLRQCCVMHWHPRPQSQKKKKQGHRWHICSVFALLLKTEIPSRIWKEWRGEVGRCDPGSLGFLSVAPDWTSDQSEPSKWPNDWRLNWTWLYGTTVSQSSTLCFGFPIVDHHELCIQQWQQAAVCLCKDLHNLFSRL